MALYKHIFSGTFSGGEVWSTTLHSVGTITLTAALRAWTSAVDAYWAAAGARFPADVVGTQVTVAEVDQSTGKQLTRVDGVVNHPGTSTADTLPPQVAEVLSLITATANRTGRGRMYWPPLALDQCANGKILTAAVAALNDAGGELLSTLASNGLTPSIYGRTAHTTKPIVSHRVDDVFDTQRRRSNKLARVPQFAVL